MVAAMVVLGPASARGLDVHWLGALTERIVADLAAGKLLVIEVHVPPCDNTIIRCGNARLGDGDHPETNLYWATTPGFGEWFACKHGAGRAS